MDVGSTESRDERGETGVTLSSLVSLPLIAFYFMFMFFFFLLPHMYECSKSPGFGTLHCGITQLAALLSGVKPLLKHPPKSDRKSLSDQIF